MAQSNFDPMSIDTVGLEIEGTILTTADVMKLFSKHSSFKEDGSTVSSSPIRKVTRDASVESYMGQLGDMRFFLGSPILRDVSRKMRLSNLTTGFELITKPLSLLSARKFLDMALPLLASGGEIFSPRASIHVHTGFPMILSALKNMVSLGLKFESLFYRVAGLGQMYRGHINHSIYAKPLAIPPVVATADGRFFKLNPEKAQFAETFEDFWDCFAVSPGHSGRYHPARYFGINIYSTALIETVEFRFFNLCLNSNYVGSIVALSQLTAELALLCEQKDILKCTGVNILEKNSESVYEEAITELLRLAGKVGAECTLLRSDVENLLNIIKRTPNPTFTDVNVLSHTNYMHRERPNDKLVAVDRTSVIASGHTDIHNFSNEERSIL